MRAHTANLHPLQFNPGTFGTGRFHPFRRDDGQIVPTLYGAERFEGALSESVFRCVPRRGPGRAIRRKALEAWRVSVLEPLRDLNLTQLSDPGLAKYPRTARWAGHLHTNGCDGLLWVSRQYDRVLAIVLFGDRVASADLRLNQPALSLHAGPGFLATQASAEAAGILIIE